MGQVDLSDYKKLYLQTAKEYVDKMSVSLGKLSGDFLNKEALNDLHISSHSLKSQSQVMGFTNIASLSAIIEKISNSALEGKSQVNDKIIPVLEESVDQINSSLIQIKKDNTENNLESIIKKLGDAV